MSRRPVVSSVPKSIGAWLDSPAPEAEIDDDLREAISSHQYLYKETDRVDDSSANTVSTEAFLVAVRLGTPYPIKVRNGRLYTSGEYLVYRAVTGPDHDPLTIPPADRCLWVVCGAGEECNAVFDRAMNPGAARPFPGSACYTTFKRLKTELLQGSRGMGLVLCRPKLAAVSIEGLESLTGHAPVASPTRPRTRPSTPAPATSPADIARITADRDKWRGEYEALWRSLNGPQEETFHYQQELDKRDALLTHAAERLTAQRDRIQALEAQISEQPAAQDDRVRELEERLRAAPSVATLEQLGSEVQRLTQELDDARGNIMSSGAERLRITDALDRMRMMAASSKKEIEDLKRESEAIILVNQKLREDSEAIRTENQKLTERLTSMSVGINAQVRDAKAAERKALLDLERITREKDARIAELEKRPLAPAPIGQQQQQPTAVENPALQAANTSLQADVARLTKENSQIPKLTENVQRLTQALMRLKSEVVKEGYTRPRSTDIDAVLGGGEYL